MNKVICDICGTTYPEAASQCPICGCAKPENAAAIMDDAAISEGVSTYTYVKGGRFSNANVRKRNQGKPVPGKSAHRKPERNPEPEEEDEPISNGGLVVILVLLILAIIAAGLYLYFNYFAQPGDAPEQTDPAGSNTSSVAEPTETEPLEIPCQDLEVSQTEVTLTAVGNAWLMNVVPIPEDTTDSITYSSSDENVATVSNEGCVTAVAPGAVTITVTCGDVIVECKVFCNFVIDEPTEPTTEATTEPTTAPEADWELNRSDITMRVGDKWTLYKGTVSKSEIKFSSDDESVATFKNGVVTAVGEGRTVVHAEYNGVKFSCIIRCKAPEENS